MFYFGKSSINDAVRDYKSIPNAILLDVREADEFRSGHIPGAVNAPLSSIRTISFPLDTPLFVYCLRGTRSKRAVSYLRRMGYRNVRSIGGITAYKGHLE